MLRPTTPGQLRKSTRVQIHTDLWNYELRSRETYDPEGRFRRVCDRSRVGMWSAHRRATMEVQIRGD